MNVKTSHPNGHFYSPVVNPKELSQYKDILWPDNPPATFGLDIKEQKKILEAISIYYPDYDYPERKTNNPLQFYTQNSQFSWLDSRLLFVLLRQLAPKRIIEVGSGFSTLLMHDVNRRFLDNTIDITAIEPYPRQFLQILQKEKGVRLVQKKVQDVDLEIFNNLQPGDFLFIDSSHVSKTGSDVNHLFFKVLPLLNYGVFIHFHDIFIPREYPEEWVIKENRSWNEQYILQAFMMYNNVFKFFTSSSILFEFYGRELSQALAYEDKRCFSGGSFWILKDK